MVAWLAENGGTVWWIGGLSAVTLVVSALLIPFVVARMHPDYFVAADPPRQVRIRLVFDGQGEAFSTLRLVRAGAGTKVSWRFTMELGMNPVTRWIGFLVADRSVGADYERGLARLKELAEAEAAAAAAEPETLPAPEASVEPESDFGPIAL